MADNDTLTPFQLWSLFTMFQSENIYFTARSLMSSCCDSAMLSLNIDNADSELEYLTNDAIDLVDISDGTYYRISNRGIGWVRQNIAKINLACKNGDIPDKIINKQDQPLLQKLRERSPDLSKTLLSCGIKNIGPIISLFDNAL